MRQPSYRVVFSLALVANLISYPGSLASQSASPETSVVGKLKKHARGPDKLGTDAAKAEISLAKQGDKQQMQRIVCELWYSKDAEAQMEATVKLGAVGGYASIKALAEVMQQKPDYNVGPRGGHLGSLQSYAVKQLAALLPEVIPAMFWNFPTTATEEQKRNWYEWIQQHRDEIYSAPQEVPNVNRQTCRAVLREQDRNISINP